MTAPSICAENAAALPGWGPLPAYASYYRAFDKTYHVLGQLKSVAVKGKAIPSVAALVEAMFIAELHNGLLTAGHDLARSAEQSASPQPKAERPISGCAAKH